MRWMLRYWQVILIRHIFKRWDPPRIRNGKVRGPNYSIALHKDTFEKHFRRFRGGVGNLYEASLIIGNLSKWDPIRMAPDVVGFMESTQDKNKFVWLANMNRFRSFYENLARLPLTDQNEIQILSKTVNDLQSLCKESEKGRTC
jgi:hypothetical protein